MSKSHPIKVNCSVKDGGKVLFSIKLDASKDFDADSLYTAIIEELNRQGAAKK